jgi:CTP:molybdopterin cytidylyltransferase MocA/HD superfamily phosphohydrolase YqeK
MTQVHYAAIILAAGFSSRMEQFKPLLRLGGETMVDRVISMFAQNNVDVFLVAGWNKEALLSGFKSHNVTVVENPDYQKGMFTSVLAGIGCLPLNYEAFFVMPVDIPLVRSVTVHRLLDEADRQPGKIIYPTFGTHRGHPPLIPSSLIPPLLQWKQDGGLKAFLNSCRDLALEVPVCDRNILFDIDAADDLQEALERLRKYDVPTEAECDVIMNVIYPMPQAVRRHCMKVAEVAMVIGSRLQQRGQKIDLEMIRAAAMLHDLAKGMPDHDKEADRMLQDMGFGKVGDLVAEHTDLRNADSQTTLEEKIVYLADKFVDDDNVVSLDKRYRTRDRRFAVTPEIEAKILRRKALALRVKRNLEQILGYTLDVKIFADSGIQVQE